MLHYPLYFCRMVVVLETWFNLANYLLTEYFMDNAV